MRRFWVAILVIGAVSMMLSAAWAQTQAQPGDPPIAALISVSSPDPDGFVTVTGAAGAVFPGAQVAVRNLFTEQTVYVGGGITGSFTARLYGPGSTPFWISPAKEIPSNLRKPGSLPGGPGTIVYGTGALPPGRSTPITKLAIDGALDDWNAYPQAGTKEPAVKVLLNYDSLYVAMGGSVPLDYAQLQLTFTLRDVTYTVQLDPRVPQAATLRRIEPTQVDLGAIPVAAKQASAIEIRVPILPIDNNFTPDSAVSFRQIDFLDASGAVLQTISLEQAVPAVAEEDGAVFFDDPFSADAKTFLVSGAVAQGASAWTALGRINTFTYKPGDPLLLELLITMDVVNLPSSLVGLQMMGRLGIQPVVNGKGKLIAGGLDSNNGWSGVQTPSGLSVDNLSGDVWLGETSVEPQQVIRRGNRLLFGLRFKLSLPNDLPPGVYVPIFQGQGRVGDGETFNWTENDVLGNGSGISREPLTRIPILLNISAAGKSHLAWTLFYDDPSDGSRGILPDEDRGTVALSNRVRYNSPTYILPPGSYPLEPYLLNQLPNASDTSAAPLIAFFTPGGRLDAQVTRPDGSQDNVGSASIVQNWISEGADNLFSANTPVNVFRLTTLNPKYTRYTFNQYGRYKIHLSGNLEDVFANTYEGGGTYSLLIAEPLALTPGVLSGTPFETGNALNVGLRVSPGVPGDVTITIRVFPLDSSKTIEKTFNGKANRFGYYHADEGFQFSTPGEYVIDYDASYATADGKLWAGSLRSAGVIADADSPLVAHGRRGVDNYINDLRPAWFTTERYPPPASPSAPAVNPILNAPYYSGDVIWLPDGGVNSIKPVIQVQDGNGKYRDWLFDALPSYTSPVGLPLQRLAALAELPLISVGGGDYTSSPALTPDLITHQAYAYVSVVRPGVTVRQFVQGSDNPDLLVAWNANEPYNGQIGAGVTGDRPGDFAFLFGGVVVRDAEAKLYDTAIYAALAMVTSPDDPLGARVYPPYRGEAGGPDGGALLTVRGQPVETFFHSTGVQPGQVFNMGDTLAVAGQVAPPLASTVSVTVTAPSGRVQQFDGIASAIGYFYDPSQDFKLDEAGVWKVAITVSAQGANSAGQIDPRDVPTGDVLGAHNGEFNVYALPPDAPPVATNKDAAADSPTRPGAPINFALTVPAGWSDVQAYHAITMPGYLLDEGVDTVQTTSFTYQYNPAQINKVFPNLEADGMGSGPSASDVVTITFVLTGKDASGAPQIRSHTFTVMHDRLVSSQ